MLSVILRILLQTLTRGALREANPDHPPALKNQVHAIAVHRAPEVKARWEETIYRHHNVLRQPWDLHPSKMAVLTQLGKGNGLDKKGPPGGDP